MPYSISYNRIDLAERGRLIKQKKKEMKEKLKREKKQKKLDKKKKQWEYIGKLTRIIVYPIVGGTGLELSKAYCTPSGLANNENLENGYQDRAVVIFHRNGGQVIFEDSVLQEFKSKQFLKSMRSILPMYKTLQRREDCYYPAFGNSVLENRFTVYDLGDKLARKLSNNCWNIAVGNHLIPKTRLGYQESMVRIRNRDQTAEILRERDSTDNEIDGYSALFSPYSLVNKEHIKQLNETFWEKKNYTYLKFRPNLVVDGKGAAYNEAEVMKIKIGLVEFDSITPNSHTKFINCEKSIQPYDLLSKNRRINMVYPRITNSNAPTFGFNMKLADGQYDEDDDKLFGSLEIKTGYKVYIQRHPVK